MYQLVFWCVVLFLALSFFGISIKGVIESPAGQANIAYLVHLAVTGWHWAAQHFAQFNLNFDFEAP